MIEMTVNSNLLRITIPKDMKTQAPLLLGAIWRDEFANSLELLLELSETTKALVDRAKLLPQILVYH